MLARKATLDDLQKALAVVNEKYENNVVWNREPSTYGNGFKFTLRVKQSRGKGARLGFFVNHKGNRRHLINACWHVHGDFFDALFSMNPKAYVWSGKSKIAVEHGNWQDRNIGSMMSPLLYSDACDCNAIAKVK